MANIVKKDGGNQNPPQTTRGELVRSDPFQLMREMLWDPFSLFQNTPWRTMTREAVWMPTFEVRETDDAFVFKGDVPGIKTSDLDIQLVGNRLQISGKREQEKQSDEGTMHAYERAYGNFTRTFTLPETADLDKIRCDLEAGVLTMVVPKKPGTAPTSRKIQISSGTKS